MESRCKTLTRCENLVIVAKNNFLSENQHGSSSSQMEITNNASIQVEKGGASSVSIVALDKEDSILDKRRRSESTSSSSSSSSTSRSSSSSSRSSFHGFSDDSIKDPDYQIVEPKRIGSCSASDDEKENINNEVSKQQDFFTPNTTPKQDLPTSETEPPAVENVSTTSVDNKLDYTPTKKGKKRPRREKHWKKNIAKRLRNCGKSYKSTKTNKTIPERHLKPACRENCTFKCRSKVTEEQRQHILEEYWNLGEIEKQWSFIANNVEVVVPKHRYVKVSPDGNIAIKRDNNNAFYLTISGVKTRVCKLFYKNTLGITNRPIETGLKKKNKDTNITLMKDNGGCHQNHSRVDESIKNGVKTFIESIPKIESHYIRANSKRHYIDGSKAITDLHRDYVDQCKSQNTTFATYVMFYRIFTQEFNISFFVPKKDLCEVCEAYKNISPEEKESGKEKYEEHHREKQLSRIEKENDKNNKNILVAVYDLQAVFQCPKGEISLFYYKSKLNVFNLTVYNIQNNLVGSFVWDESNANRGVNEIATCVFTYLRKVSETVHDLDVVFYSDNCAGQQKNKFMVAMYLYAVQTFPNLKSVTHKYLIKGHTQNEGDSAHSQIEREVKRQLRSGPMYTPDAFIGAIKAARKKSEPIHVHEMCFQDIYDWKNMCNQMNFALLKDEENNKVKLSGIKVITVKKNSPNAIFFKNSYADEQFKMAIVLKKKKNNLNLDLKGAYSHKPGLAEKKKCDIMDLVNKNLIPKYHKPFFEAL